MLVYLWLVRSITGSLLGSGSSRSSPKSISMRVPLDVSISVKAPPYLVSAFQYLDLHRLAPYSFNVVSILLILAPSVS